MIRERVFKFYTDLKRFDCWPAVGQPALELTCYEMAQLKEELQTGDDWRLTCLYGIRLLVEREE